jgi:hypothetical protein
MLPSTDALLTRDALATALAEAGFPISGATLATKATRGGGPPYRLFGRRPLYEWGPSLAWAQDRLSDPASNSFEHGAGAARAMGFSKAARVGPRVDAAADPETILKLAAP